MVQHLLPSLKTAFEKLGFYSMTNAKEEPFTVWHLNTNSTHSNGNAFAFETKLCSNWSLVGIKFKGPPMLRSVTYSLYDKGVNIIRAKIMV